MLARCPLCINLPQRREIDLHQHRDDHHPDQQADRNVHMGDFQRADRLCGSGQSQTEEGAGNDAEKDPERQITLEESERDAGRFLPGHFTLTGHR